MTQDATPVLTPDGSSRRIVSLVPSLTETVAEAGLKADIVGITGFCSHPKGLHKTAQIVGGTKDPDLEAIAALRPSHILVNDEENKPEHIAWLKERFDLLSTFPKSIAEVPTMLAAMAEFLAAGGSAGQTFEAWQRQLTADLAKLSSAGASGRTNAGASGQPRKVLYFIWREPYMVAGHDTYISRSIALAGLSNLLPAANTDRYPTISEEQIAALAAEPGAELWLSSEPYPFRRRDIDRLRPLVGEAIPIRKVDGRLHSWYGYSSLALAAALQALQVLQKPAKNAR